MKKELEVRTKRFALSVIRLLGKLARGKVSDVIGYQLLKAALPSGPTTEKPIELNRMTISFTK
jgi:hypothetical protein